MESNQEPRLVHGFDDLGFWRRSFDYVVRLVRTTLHSTNHETDGLDFAFLVVPAKGCILDTA
jgi:hypothetical protein